MLFYSQVPAMDKLYYYVRKTDTMLAECVDEIDEGVVGVEFRATCFKINCYLSSKKGSKTRSTDSDDDDDDDSSIEEENLPRQPSRSSEEEDSEEDDANEDDVPAAITIGARILNAWQHRRKKLVSNYAITAWMLSPVEDIMADASTNHSGEDREAVARLLAKLLVPQCATEADTEIVKGEMLNIFWEELEHFHAKTGPFANKPHIWNSNDLTNNQSHIWHKKNSLRYTEVLGRLACIVCSKILGIGSAERCWGDVKQNKNGKRSHLSAEAIKMQATIFGTYSAEKADIKRKSKDCAAHFWEDEDFHGLGLSKYGVDIHDLILKAPTKIFRAWLEEWEKEILEVNDPVHQARLLEKYGGMVWHDPDFNEMLTANSDMMFFSRKRGERGYCVYGVKETWREGDADDDDTWEPWALNDDLYQQIAEYYEKNPQANIQIVRLTQDDTVV
jgi:hypothetical protein